MQCSLYFSERLGVMFLLWPLTNSLVQKYVNLVAKCMVICICLWPVVIYFGCFISSRELIC
ncbi:hypothetical protein RchiOBHm_Chr7g0206771 [Rosa chinensis]|uniref:Uncharacterized protein n=1 Tax=Rosa chinensis TaxID=74649 RepID=A0A2P6P997_ROSCH|nr:hypothetical protein RchiOBHm_Chr7g0206771 [Rosa chinensis]